MFLKQIFIALLLSTSICSAADLDGNGVPDEVEQALVERFKPCMVLPYSDRGVAPEPVDIMHVNSYITGYNSVGEYYYKVPKLWVTFYNKLGQYVCTRTLFRVYEELFVDYNASWNGRITFSIGKYSNWVNETYSYWGKPPDPETNWAWDEYFIRLHADYAGPNNGDGYYDQPDGWYDAYLNGRTVTSGTTSFTWDKGSDYPATTYVHLFSVASGKVVIQYWFFYPFNAGGNNHEGDWEHVNVIADFDGVNVPTAQIDKIVYYFHKKYYIDYPSTGYTKIIDNTHPVVFVGGHTHSQAIALNGQGTHASYPTFGKWPSISYILEIPVEEDVIYHTNYAQYINYNSLNPVIIKNRSYYNYDTNPEMSWLGSNIRWGHISVKSPGDWVGSTDIGQYAPDGPAWHASWSCMEGGSETAYGYAPYDLPTSWSWPTDNAAPTVSINYPSSGSYFIKSRQYKIQWYATDNIGGTNGIKNCLLYYSIDGGYNWSAIAGANPILNYNWFNWNVPDVESKNCKIKIVAYDAMGYSAETISSTFAIGSIFAVPTIYGSVVSSNTKVDLPDVSLRSTVNKPYADQAKYKPRYCEFSWAGRVYSSSIVDCGTYYRATILHEAVTLPRTYTAKWVYNIWEGGVVVGMVEGPRSSSYTVYPPNPNDPIVAETNTAEATAYSNGKKIMVDNTGTLHVVFASNDSVYYCTSTDDGNTWSTANSIGQGKNPAIEISGSQKPMVCWSKGNELYRAEKDSLKFTEPQMFYAGPEGTEISYLSYVVDQNTDNSYLGWVDDGPMGSAVYVSSYNPNNSASLRPTPIDHGGRLAFKSPSLALDKQGNLKTVWSKNGSVFFNDENGQIQIGDNGIHPIVDTYGDKTTVVWQEEIAPNVYQVVKKTKGLNGWSDKEIISYPDSLNADFPVVVAAGQYVYSKNVNGSDYDLIWNAEYDNGWSIHTQNLSGAQGGISRYPSIAFKQSWPKSKLYVLWTEEMPAKGAKAIAAPLVKAYTMSVDPVPCFYLDLGTEETGNFTIQKKGTFYYGLHPDFTVDYHPTVLKYSIQNLDPTKKYRIKVVYYQETDNTIKQTLTVDKTFNVKSKIEPKTVVTEEHWIPNSCIKDGQIEVTITKTIGEYAVCSVIALYEYDRDCDGKSSEDIAESGSKLTPVYSYELMQNYPNPNTGMTAIKYQLPKAEKVNLKIYNTIGQVVKTLVSQEQPMGYYNVTWNGRDNAGKIAANGVYIYRLEAGDFKATKKMVVIR